MSDHLLLRTDARVRDCISRRCGRRVSKLKQGVGMWRVFGRLVFLQLLTSKSQANMI